MGTGELPVVSSALLTTVVHFGASDPRGAEHAQLPTYVAPRGAQECSTFARRGHSHSGGLADRGAAEDQPSGRHIRLRRKATCTATGASTFNLPTDANSFKARSARTAGASCLSRRRSPDGPVHFPEVPAAVRSGQKIGCFGIATHVGSDRDHRGKLGADSIGHQRLTANLDRASDRFRVRLKKSDS